MGWWIRALSVVFVVSSMAVSSYVFLHGRNSEQLSAQAMKLRPVFDTFVNQGGAALKSLFEISRVTFSSAESPLADTPQLNSIQSDYREQLSVEAIEQKNLSAHPTRMPAARAQSIHPNEVSELRDSQGAAQSPADLSPVEARLRMRVPQDVLKYFDLVLYISKAADDKGTWAQKMFVLSKTADQVYELQHNWPVSTGMEKLTKAPSGRLVGTHTPEGLFRLDRNRSYEDYTSRQWKSTMPYAMFFDWKLEGRVSGLAIHGSDVKDEAELGKRASHGCIRLATPNARVLFELIMSQYKGRMPQFRIDPETDTMSTKGILARDESGNVQMTPGYKVLVFIEDFGGPSDDTVAALF